MKKSQLQQLVREVLQEQRLKPILKEGAISLTPDEIKQVEDLVPKVINAIKQNKIGTTIDTLNYVMADRDKTPASARVLLYHGGLLTGIFAKYDTHDVNKMDDNDISINYEIFKAIINRGTKIWFKATGNSPIQSLKLIITHELIHAKDPAVNHHYLDEPYEVGNEKLYLGSWAEFQTMTGQFFELIKSISDEYVKYNRSGFEGNISLNYSAAKELMFVYDDILNTFAGKKKFFDKRTRKWFAFRKGFKKNLVQKFINHAAKFFINFNTLDTLVNILQKIKKYNPEGYKEFLKDLYKLIGSLKDKYKDEIVIAQKQYDLYLKATGKYEKPKSPSRPSIDPDWFQVKTPR